MSKAVTLFLALVVVGMLVGSVTTYLQTTADTQVAAVVQTALPAYIRIPVIGVDAVIDTSALPDTVYFEYASALPGTQGVARMSGSAEDVFNRLHELQEGDELFIQNMKGDVMRFVVGEGENMLELTASNDVRIRAVFVP